MPIKNIYCSNKHLLTIFLTSGLHHCRVCTWNWNKVLTPSFIFELMKKHRMSLFKKSGVRNLYPFMQGSLESKFSELYLSDASVWNQYKLFDVCSCWILIISCKILIITVISNETKNKLCISTMLSWNVTLF